jgi:hypothetical protein
MALITQTRKPRVDSPARWQNAAARAITEGIRIAQVQGSGQWIATSGTQDGVAYAVEVTGNIAHGCDCLAGLNDDPVCKHRAAYYLLIGALNPEPDPPTPVLAPVICFRCRGLDPKCAVCGGAGAASLVAQAAALVTAADRIAA